jgi:hypothetical protein
VKAQKNLLMDITMAGNSSSQILKLGVDEMFEDLTYNIAYGEVLKRLKASGMDNSMLEDAINSGLTIMFSAALMKYIQTQEKILDVILNSAISLLVVILNPFVGAAKNLVKRFAKGVKLGFLSKFIGISAEARVGYAQVVTSGANAMFNSKQAENQHFQHATYSHQKKSELLHSKDQQLAYAKAKADSFNQTLLFKLFASKFTAADKEIIRKMTGGSADIDIEKLNEIANFMWVTDSAGNITGLSEAFIQMLNGLGYFHNKTKKGK